MNVVPSRVPVCALLLFTLLCLLLTAGVSPAAGVRVYRCKDAAGGVEFRQTRCPFGEEAALQVRNSLMGWVKAARAERPVPPAAAESQGGEERAAGDGRSAAGQVGPLRCWQAGIRLERTERALRRGYKASQSGRLHQRQREQKLFLRRFCR